MVKVGMRFKTEAFGTDAERYVAELTGLVPNPRRDRRPDLISAERTYSPRLTLEVKSGRNGRVVFNANQLHYGETPHLDYSGVEDPSEVSYYYNVVARIDNVSPAQLDDLSPQYGLNGATKC